MARIAAILLLGATLSALPAHAERPSEALSGSSANAGPGDALMRLNLIGRWAHDCADPASKRITYQVAPDGTALLGNEAGTHRILSVESKDGREIAVTIKFVSPAEEVRINVLTMLDRDTYVPKLNRNERNEYTVRDGILLRTGQKMPELHRCGSELSRVDGAGRIAAREAARLPAL